DQWIIHYQPRSPIEHALLEQALAALLEIRRCRKVRATLQVEKVRTAQLHWEFAQEDEVDRCRFHYDKDPPAAYVATRRTAAGCRWAIERWEYLAKLLDDEGSWYGINRIEAIQLQGLSARIDDLYHSEEAYTTWLHCIAAQPNPRARDIEILGMPTVIPKA